MEIWRIENMQPVKMDPSTFGQFYSGDSYLVLWTMQPRSALEWNLHFWLGTDSSQDERGVAARLKALEHSHRQGLVKMERLIASAVRGATVPAAAPQVIVTPPAPTSFSAAAAVGGGGAGAGGVPRARRPGPGGAQGQGQAAQGRAAGPPPPFFNRGRPEGGLPAGQGRQLRQDRSSSAGKSCSSSSSSAAASIEWQWCRHRPQRTAPYAPTHA